MATGGEAAGNMQATKSIRIGAGAGFSGDRIDPAAALAERGDLDYLVFECLAERTIALAQRARLTNPEAGYDPLLDERMRAVLPACVAHGTRIISNMGAANPAAAARATAAIARELGLTGLKIAAVLGDDVREAALTADLPMIDRPHPVSGFGDALISANAYLGCGPIADALAAGADVVLTGRAADPSLFLGPMVHEFGWALDDWARLGAGTCIGHLLECAGQITGGYFADPGLKDIAGLADLGFPLAEVSSDGTAVITKLADAGGQVTLATCKEQLLYEVHDPAAYLTPDVTADFSGVRFEAVGPDRIAVAGASGRERPPSLKVSVGYDEGFIGEGQISYAGPGCVARARLAGEIVEHRLKRLGEGTFGELRWDLIGVDAVNPLRNAANAEPAEVRLRVVARSMSEAAARQVGREVDGLYTNGPAGGGGVMQAHRPVIAVASALLERAAVEPRLVWEVS